MSFALKKLWHCFKQPTVFTLYLAYAAYYLPRKCDSVVKVSLLNQGFTVEQIAFADTVYLLTYTLAMLFSGSFGKYISSNKLLAGSLLGICITSALKSMQMSPMRFTFIQIMHAIFQSSGWPTCIKILAAWITKDRGFLMGVWTTCQSVGGVLGAVFASYILNEASFSAAYLGHIPILVIVAGLCFLLVKDEPSRDTASYSFKDDKDLEKSGPAGPVAVHKDISFAQLIVSPPIFSVAISYFFLKFLRYALLMWLPFYFEEALQFDGEVAGYLSSFFELGGLFGTPFIGYFSDQVMNGDLTKTASLFMGGASIALVFCIMVANQGVALNGITMLSVGVLVIGPDSVMSGTVINDLVMESGFGVEALGKVAGLINSIGSFGAIFQAATTAVISEQYGWTTLFWVFVLCSTVSSLVLAAAILSRPKVGYYKPVAV